MDSQKNSSKKLDVYQIVTDQIISLFEKEIIPWQQPWTAGVPMNLLSKRQYRGINLWLLISLNYEQNFFLTWDQLKSIGGSVKKDEKGHVVLYWKPSQNKSEEESSEKKSTSILRYYKVFNVSQCRDIPSNYLPKLELNITEHNTMLECEPIIHGMPDCPKIQHKQQKAYYDIETDIINMPKKKSFKSEESYYSTLYHELVHSTGAEKRLGRKTLTDMVPFGSESYAMEELIAEMGSAYLCHDSGILPNEIKDKVSYLSNWLEVFKNDKRFIVTASGHAQKAVDFVLNRKENESKDEVNQSLDESMVS
ncbi:MAG: hypothetical protein JWO92_894 [Chitinophagaceae bacterium]|nr:hypothetical protein [Chitinophagaceae bacterium]